MSALNLFDISEQICYVQCGFCTTILLVSVPCSSMTMVVTVRCGHCTGLLSVNMTKAAFVPLHLFASINSQNIEQKEGDNLEELDTQSPEASSDNEDDQDITLSVNQLVNKPPERRQRAPSAYNRFIREEIKRLKAENPNMAHKEAFSTAAKNWAQFPQLDPYKLEDGENGSERERQNVANWDSDHVNKVHEDGKVFHETKLANEDSLFLW